MKLLPPPYWIFTSDMSNTSFKSKYARQSIKILGIKKYLILKMLKLHDRKRYVVISIFNIIKYSKEPIRQQCFNQTKRKQQSIKIIDKISFFMSTFSTLTEIALK